MLDIPEMRDALHFVLELTDIYMPSEGEVLLLSPHSTPERAIAGFLEEGVKEVIVKRGNQGASYYPRMSSFMLRAIRWKKLTRPVQETALVARGLPAAS